MSVHSTVQSRRSDATGQGAITVDSKALRGSRTVDTAARHVMAAYDQVTAVVLADTDVDGKTNEITRFRPLLDQIGDLRDTVITADALHCRSAAADAASTSQNASPPKPYTPSPTCASTRPDQIQLAAWIRGHWAIENKIPRVRDVTYDEDRSQVRTDTGPEVMAALLNTAIGALRTAGITTAAAGTRHHARDSSRPLALLGIT